MCHVHGGDVIHGGGVSSEVDGDWSDATTERPPDDDARAAGLDAVAREKSAEQWSL